MKNVLILHVFMLCVFPCMHDGRSHTERCSPVSMIRELHKHGERGERERTGRERWGGGGRVEERDLQGR